MMNNPMVSLIEKRTSANRFDVSHVLSDAYIEELIRLATRAPSAYNLQNWRFIAVKAPAIKARLKKLAYGQEKVSDAAVTFIVCGQLPNYLTLQERLLPFVKEGFMPIEMAATWQNGARIQYTDPQNARDEAVRSATLAAATLIYAAEAHDLVSGPMVGFDAGGVIKEFGLAHNEVPVMLIAVGRPSPGNWPQKPRRPVTEVLEIL